jgi:hypothetical protein
MSAMVSAASVELDAGGHVVWGERFGDAGLQRTSALALDGQGGVLLGGTFFGNIDLGGGPVAKAPGWGSFVARLDGAGHHVWSKAVTGDVANVGALAPLPGGGALVGGDVASSLDLGCGPLAGAHTGNAYLATLDAAGACTGQRSLGPSGDQHVGGMTAGPAGHVAATGSFQTALDLGTGPVPATGVNDGFVFEIAPPCMP